MKRFRLTLTVVRIVVGLLLLADVVFMVRLYGSIRGRYIDDVEQSLARAVQIETVDRIVNSGKADSRGVVWLAIGLQKSDVRPGMTAEQLREAAYSQGYRRVDRQVLDYMNSYLHENYDGPCGEADTEAIEQAFRLDLAFSGYYPAMVDVVAAGKAAGHSSSLWTIDYAVDGKPLYQAFISPLTGNILAEMSAVIITSALLFIVLTLGFFYLLTVIKRQRTIEEMKDDFTNNMTHELKTPIAIAYAANDALLQFPDPTDEARTRRYLTAALEQLTRLSGLVESILSISIERRKNLTMRMERIDVRPFMENIIAAQRIKASKPCEFRLDCPPGSVIEADPVHLANVMSNLIDNSLKYSGEEVTVTITVGPRSIAVEDNGIGIPDRSLPEVFTKFYRVPHGNRHDVGGYGIGLFYVRTIVEKHGWTVTAESRLGKGSKFIIVYA